MVYNSWLLITWKNPTKIIIGIPFFRQDRVRSLRSIQRHNLGTLGYAAYKIKRTLSIQMVYKSIKIRYPQILGLLKDFKVSFKIFFYFLHQYVVFHIINAVEKRQIITSIHFQRFEMLNAFYLNSNVQYIKIDRLKFHISLIFYWLG